MVQADTLSPVCLSLNWTQGALGTDDVLVNFGIPGYVDQPYNVIAMGVLNEDGTSDASGTLSDWEKVAERVPVNTRLALIGTTSPKNAEVRTALRAIDKAHGITRLAWVFGATGTPIANGADANNTAANIANYVNEYALDGVLIDWHEAPAFFNHSATGEIWLEQFTTQLRTLLGNDAVIAHAPQAPYFSGSVASYPSGGYLRIHNNVGALIDWYSVEFFNQGSTTYDSYQTLIETANGWAANTAVLQIINGDNDLGIAVDADKILIHKPATASNASAGGFVSASNLVPILNSLIAVQPIRGVATSFYHSDRANGFGFGNEVCTVIQPDRDRIFDDGFELP